MSDPAAPPTPERIFNTLTAYQQSAALKGAIDLDLFSAIAAGATDVASLAQRIRAQPRGVRSLCDYLVVHGFLTRDADGTYRLTPDSAAFLDQGSSAYMGSASRFLNSPMLLRCFSDVAATVRHGGTVDGEGTVAVEHEVWVDFARAMAPMAQVNAELLADHLAARDLPRRRVLDVAAGHGHYGVALARRHDDVHVTALDWPNVLVVATETAAAAGVGARHTLRPGNALVADLAGPYDLVLLTNFLHHFDAATCVAMLQRVRAALAPGGCSVTLEFTPNDDRVTPPHAAAFSLVMLATTPRGDAYTIAELESMHRSAGFVEIEVSALSPSNQTVMIAR